MKVKYLKNRNGSINAVLLPIDLWNRIIPTPVINNEEIIEDFEDFLINNAIEEGLKTQSFNKQKALDYLND